MPERQCIYSNAFLSLFSASIPCFCTTLWLSTPRTSGPIAIQLLVLILFVFNPGDLYYLGYKKENNNNNNNNNFYNNNNNLYNNPSVNLATGVAYVDGQTGECRAAGAGAGSGRGRTTCADRLRARAKGERRNGVWLMTGGQATIERS